METRASPLNDPQLRIQDGPASRIIGGNTLDDCKMLEEPGETDVWFLEMGDDSVFYSDEEQSFQDKDAIASSHLGSGRCKRLVNSVADCETNQQQAWDPDELIINKRSLEIEKKVTKQDIWYEEVKRIHTPKNERACVSEAADDVMQGKFMKSGIALQPNRKTIHMQMQHELHRAAQKVNQVKQEVGLKHPPSNQNLSDVCHKEGHPKRSEETEISKQPSDAELHISDDMQPEVDLEVHAGLSPNPIPSKSAPLKKSDISTFNHLTSSKYSTVSYRRIRRGNTQEKIQEFEFMLMNL